MHEENLLSQDGGCTSPGDVAKAFGAGADFVMIGGMFAGHDESGGELIELPNGTKRKQFYGMASATAMKKYAGGVAEYRYNTNCAQVKYHVATSTLVLPVRVCIPLTMHVHVFE